MALLSFSRLFPWGAPTNFETKIKAGVKIHTLRFGNGWYAGRPIDFWVGSPRNEGSYKFFIEDFDKALEWKTIQRKDNEKNDYSVNLPICSAVESFTMQFERLDDPEKTTIDFRIGELEIDENLIEAVAAADGFDNAGDFVRWFLRSARKKADKAKAFKLSGQMIHWTDKVYDLDRAQTTDHDYFKNSK